MSKIMNEIVTSLKRIAIALEATALPAPEGFFNYGPKVYCNVSKGNSDGWYTLCGETADTQAPIFCGRVAGIAFPTVERRMKEVIKFHLFMRASGEVTTFESGNLCFFSKTILAAFATTSPEVLKQPIQLATYVKTLNTGDTTLAVVVRDHAGHRLNCDWTNDSDWHSITEQAVANVNAAIL